MSELLNFLIEFKIRAVTKYIRFTITFVLIMALLVSENVKVAFHSIRSQALRTTLTIVIIALGLTVLVGVLALMDIIKSSINSNFSNLGANTFTIRNKETTVRIGRGGKRPKKFRNITYEEAMKFKKDFNFPATVS